jgi:predicted amidophosphoribosyltransferase
MDEELNSSNDIICPNSSCEYDHHQKGANFCTLCGTLLYQRCEDCLSANPQYGKFCHYCGTSLLELRSMHGQYEGTEEA